MRILYIAPRYHTNQIPIMKGLTEHNHEVHFFSHYEGKIEYHEYVEPEIIGYSGLYQLFDHFYTKVMHPGNPAARDFRLQKGFPSVFIMNRELKRVNPELVILRERSVYSIISYWLCRLHGYPCILYNQSPLWDKKREDIAHKLVDKLTPRVRMTPVMGEDTPGLVRDKYAFFVPFVMETKLSPEGQIYCSDGIMHIFTVGKYEKRKNLQMMIEAVEALQTRYPVQLTIAGECTTTHHKELFDSLSRYIEEHRLQNVTLKKNLNKDEMDKEYRNADLFVLPSTGEPASISQLEAMAYSLPVICSDTNGTACYVHDGVNGYRFKDKDQIDLQNKIELLISNPASIKEMGAKGFDYLLKNCQFENYYAGIMKCLEAVKETR